MIKKLRKFAFVLAIFFVKTTFAQLPNGSIAPNFTYNDLDGVSRNLYTYLNQGKTVYLDVSAAWCGPCWNYHSGVFRGGDDILKYIKVTSVTSITGISSYTSAPTITITGGGGSGATAQAVLTNGVVTKINVTDHGTGYTSASTIVVGTPWAATTALALGDQIFSGNNLYTVTTAGTTSSVAATHTSAYAGTPWITVTTLTTGTQIYYGNKLYTVTTAGVTGSVAPTHTSVYEGSLWTSVTTLTTGTQIYYGNNLYTVTTAGVTSAVAPTHTSVYEGTLWTSVTTLTTGTQIYYGNNLYVVSTDGVTGTDPVTHTSGSAVDGTAVLDYVGQTGPEQNNGTAVLNYVGQTGPNQNNGTTVLNYVGQTGPERNNGTAVLKYAGIAAKANVPAGGFGKEAALHELWRKHGPIGQPGVEAGSTDDVVVLFLEAETTNTLAQLNGVNAGSTSATNTKGDWVSGTSYPIIDLPNNT